jgi:tetratricopeptide (TPR) repeat protein
MSDDWFRNTDWNAQIEVAFFAKLRRARRKEQYLRIQASTIAKTHPKVALHLLDKYFTLNDNFDHAQGHVARATAYLAMGDLDSAIQSYEDALAREEEFPNLQTQAHLDLPYLIALRHVARLYDRALQLLDMFQSRLLFPVDHFRWQATRALILSAKGNALEAKLAACAALGWTEQTDSGFRYHPKVGLVGVEYKDVESALTDLCNA